MIFFLAVLFMIIGITVAGICGILPIMTIAAIPSSLRLILFLVGIIISFVGYILLYGRAQKTGARYLINPAKKGENIWFYAYRDGSILITPGIRAVESQLYSPELDAQIQEYRSYRIFDHSVRFVPEGIGHAVDLGICLYAQLLKGKYGFERLEEAREAASILEKKVPIIGKKQPVIPHEGVITEQVIKKAQQLVESDTHRTTS